MIPAAPDPPAPNADLAPFPPRRPGPAWLPLTLLPLLVCLLCLVAFGFSAGVDLMGSPNNAFYDMDTTRVISDWTSWSASGRPRTHPIYKYIAFLGMPVNAVAFDGAHPASAARLLSIGFLALQIALAGHLAWRLTNNPWAAAIVMALLGASFSTFLHAAIPDTASASGIFTLLPFVLWAECRGRPFTPAEAALWVLVALGGYGVTISQVLPVAVAFWFRFGEIRSAMPRVLWGRYLAAMGVGFVALVVGLKELQEEIFPGTESHYKINEVVKKEFKFFESEQVFGNPLGRLADQAAQSLVYTFVSPEPVIAEWSPPRETRRFLSITLVDEDFRSWRWWHAPAVAGTLALLGAGLWHLRRRPWALALGIPLLAQALLHFVYGREFLIYAPNWHGMLVVMLICALPAGWWRGPWLRTLLVVYTLLLVGMNLHAVQRTFEIYREDFDVPYAFSIIEPPG